MKRLLWALLVSLVGIAIGAGQPGSEAGEKGGWVAVQAGPTKVKPEEFKELMGK